MTKEDKTLEELRTEFFNKFVVEEHVNDTNCQDYDNWMESEPEQVFDWFLQELSSLEQHKDQEHVAELVEAWNKNDINNYVLKKIKDYNATHKDKENT